jgi:peptidyl-prolyl cis-trans isomerase C
MNIYAGKSVYTLVQLQKKRWVPLLVLLTIVSLACISIPALAAEKQVTDGIVAVVNGTPIPRAHFDSGMALAKQKLADSGRSVSASELPDFKKGVLEALIDRELLYQQSQSARIKVEDAAVDNEINAMKKQFPDEQEFKKALVKSNTSEAEMKSQVKKRLAVQQFIDEQFARNVTVSDNEAKSYYNSHKDVFKVPEQVRARHILIRVDAGADESKKAATRKKLKEIQKRLRNSEDFVMLAKAYSEGSSEARGEAVYFRKGQMEKPFEEAAFALKPGEVSDIVETSAGYHLINVVGLKPETMMTFEEVQDRIKQHLKEQKIKKKVQRYLEKLKRKAKIERFTPED